MERSAAPIYPVPSGTDKVRFILFITTKLHRVTTVPLAVACIRTTHHVSVPSVLNIRIGEAPQRFRVKKFALIALFFNKEMGVEPLKTTAMDALNTDGKEKI